MQSSNINFLEENEESLDLAESLGEDCLVEYLEKTKEYLSVRGISSIDNISKYSRYITYLHTETRWCEDMHHPSRLFLTLDLYEFLENTINPLLNSPSKQSVLLVNSAMMKAYTCVTAIQLGIKTKGQINPVKYIENAVELASVLEKQKCDTTDNMPTIQKLDANENDKKLGKFFSSELKSYTLSILIEKPTNNGLEWSFATKNEYYFYIGFLAHPPILKKLLNSIEEYKECAVRSMERILKFPKIQPMNSTALINLQCDQALAIQPMSISNKTSDLEVKTIPECETVKLNVSPQMVLLHSDTQENNIPNSNSEAPRPK